MIFWEGLWWIFSGHIAVWRLLSATGAGVTQLVTFVCSLRHYKEMGVPELELLRVRQFIVLSHCSFLCSLWGLQAPWDSSSFCTPLSGSCDQTAHQRLGTLVLTGKASLVLIIYCGISVWMAAYLAQGWNELEVLLFVNFIILCLRFVKFLELLKSDTFRLPVNQLLILVPYKF